jgi:hypothetical protein
MLVAEFLLAGHQGAAQEACGGIRRGKPVLQAAGQAQ